ncbi:MAG: ASKHA domain-containing protein, partial [Pseudomonadota bacterium]
EDIGDELYEIIDIEPGNTFNKQYCIALDIGTTTVCGELIDIYSNKVIASAATYNKQIECCGDDVITRIIFAKKQGGKKKLQEAVVYSINKVIKDIIAGSGVSKKDILFITSAGNTTMTHLLLKIEPRYIREAPYIPATRSFPSVSAQELGIKGMNKAKLRSFPAVSSYVGGDVVAGVLATGMYKRDREALLIDIGTNGEIVFGNREWLICAACSMGPAFEGWGIIHGMRADTGAIEGVKINPYTLEPIIITINKGRPRGICGSGLISLLAELVYASVIDKQGKFIEDVKSDRIRKTENGYEYILVKSEYTDIFTDIVITEADIENLIRAKAALFAGSLTLVESVGLSLSNIDHIFIAGAFGRFLNLEKAKIIGLLPDMPIDKFSFVGNSSLGGARVASLSKSLFKKSEEIALKMTNIELSENQLFMNNYMAALFLPHTNSNLFPDVNRKIAETEAMIRNKQG